MATKVPKKVSRTKIEQAAHARAASTAAVQKRVESVARLLCMGHRPTQVVDAVCQNYSVGITTAYGYINSAKEVLRDMLGVPTEDLIALHYGMLHAIIADEGSRDENGHLKEKPPHAVKLAAIKEAISLLGLQQPTQINVGTGPDQGPLSLTNILVSLNQPGAPVIGDAEIDAVVREAEAKALAIEVESKEVSDDLD